LKTAFADKMTEVYLLCYSHVLQYFVRLNLFLQRDEPIIAAIHEQVHTVYPSDIYAFQFSMIFQSEIQKFLKVLFIPISAFRDVELSTVDYKNRAIQLPGRHTKLINALCNWNFKAYNT